MTRKSTVKEACQAIRRDYELGRKLLDKYGERIDYNSIERITEEWGVTADRFRKLRQLALEYTPEQLEDLLALCKEHDRPIGISFLYKLVSVPKANRQRYLLQLEMVREGWSRAELDRQILARFGRRNNAGRKRAIPENVQGLISQVERECHTWLRWEERVQTQLGEGDVEATTRVRQLLEQTAKQMTRLREVSQKLLNAYRD